MSSAFSDDENSSHTDDSSSEGEVTFDYEQLDFDIDVGMDFSPSKRVKKLSKQVQSSRTNFKKIVDAKRKQIEKESQRPPIVRLMDKVSFTLGIANIALTMLLLGKFPEKFYLLYSIKLPLLMGLRYYMYHKNKWHYFMLDFCYFTNAVFLLYLHAFPQSCSLFKLCFAVTAGPLSWAIALWNNSMVFHSLDKVTSLFIHITPALVMWCLRWYPGEEFNNCYGAESISWTDAVVFPVLFYCFWQLVYFLKVQIYDRYKFQNDPNYMTSFRYLTSEKQKNTMIYRLSNYYGKKYQMILFGVLQLVYTILTFLPVKLFYGYYWAHTLFLFAMCMVSAWNGATFYIEVFSVRYQQTLKECEAHYQELANLVEGTDSTKKTS